MRAKRAAADLEESEPTAAPIFTSLRGGLQQMIDALVARLEPGRLHLHTPVAGLQRLDGGWRVSVAGMARNFDAVVMAVPAWAAAELLRPVDGVLSGALAEIPYSSSVTVNLVYAGADLDPLPPGFGFLVPASERKALLACTFIHRKFPGRTAPGKTVLRAFVGGTRNAGLLGDSDADLEELVRRELRQILHLSARPELVEVQRWPRAMALYAVGHRERIGRIEERVAGLPGLHLVGNAYDGIGISDCIRLGRRAGREVAQGCAAAVSSQQVNVRGAIR